MSRDYYNDDDANERQALQGGHADHEYDDYDDGDQQVEEDEEEHEYDDEHQRYDPESYASQYSNQPSRPSFASSLIGSPNFDSSSTGHSSMVVREGVELVHDEEDDDDEEGEEEIEVDSDVEQEVASAAERRRKALEMIQPQKCNNRIFLYLLGVVAAMACEFLILLPAYYLRLFVVGLLYIVLWLSFATCAVSMGVCPGRRKPHSHCALALYVATLAAYIGGMSGAYFYKQAWYFEQPGSAYTNVDPNLGPGESNMQNPTFLEFIQNPPNTTSYVIVESPPVNGTKYFGWYRESPDSTAYCVAPVFNAQRDFDMQINYWAIGEDCCHKAAGQEPTYSCAYWNQNIPGVSQELFQISAEVLPDREFQPYRHAIDDWVQTTKLEGKDAPDSLLVLVMTLNDHLERQDERRQRAWIALLGAAGLWPILLAIFLGLLSMGEDCFKKKSTKHIA